uniref:CYRIA/CYRIB Rac1 binding domain-containing protein n=1 Tax=Ficedula albicollis TaxID=59894 RepID=A0A803VNG0_FICAL
MGNLLKVLTYNELDQGPNFFLDFENAQPTEAETAVWNQVNAVLEEAQTILAELQSYTGAGQEIREAIQNPGDLRLQERAWSAVCPLVAKLKRFYEFSLRLENALRSLLEALTSPPYAPTQHLEREQALAKQFAEILHFTLSFDELKMTNPAIQNDFSYYRRTISRNRINNLQLDAESEVNNEMANRMSLFYAEATPMLKTLSNATTKFVSEVREAGGTLRVGGEPLQPPHMGLGVETAAGTCWVSEQDPPHRGHDRLPEHHGLRVQGDAGDPVSAPLWGLGGRLGPGVPLPPQPGSGSSPLAQGVPEPLHQHRDLALLHEGDGRSHHPLRPRPPRGGLRQDLQDRCEWSWGDSCGVTAVPLVPGVPLPGLSSEEEDGEEGGQPPVDPTAPLSAPIR